jgi:hypothetical protein
MAASKKQKPSRARGAMVSEGKPRSVTAGARADRAAEVARPKTPTKAPRTAGGLPDVVLANNKTEVKAVPVAETALPAPRGNPPPLPIPIATFTI